MGNNKQPSKEIIVKMVCAIKGNFIYDEKSPLKDFPFTTKVPNRSDINLVINTDERRIIAYQKVLVSDDSFGILLKKVCDGNSIEPKPKKYVINELKALGNDIMQAVNKLLSAMNIFFRWENVSDLCSWSAPEYEWSNDGTEWKQCPVFLEGAMKLWCPLSLIEETQQYIQQYLDGEGWEPFLAFNYLNRSKNEHNTNFKWIDATIAAELAIKEFYIRLAPQLEAMILEMPSPPIDLLYGRIMESLINKKSPKVKEIKNGIEKRNKLVHKPKELEITDAEALKYIEDIEYAIYHLLSILYGDEDFTISQVTNPRTRVVRRDLSPSSEFHIEVT